MTVALEVIWADRHAYLPDGKRLPLDQSLRLEEDIRKQDGADQIDKKVSELCKGMNKKMENG